MKKLFMILFSAYSVTAFSQDTVKVLQLKPGKHFKESNQFSTGPVLHIKQEVNYNDPGVYDEEYDIMLGVRISNIRVFKKLKKLDVQKDTGWLKCFHNWHSAWSFGGAQSNIAGSIKLLSWQKNTLRLSFDVTVTQITSKDVYRYEGERTFYLTKKQIVFPKQNEIDH